MSKSLWGNLRPWCIGRFVFDRPMASEISNQRYQYRGDKLYTTQSVSIDFYRNKVNSLQDDLRKKKRTDPGGPGATVNHAWLETEFSPTDKSRVFVYQKIATEGVAFPFETEGYIYDTNVLFHTVGRIGSSAIGRVESIYDDTYKRIKVRDNWSVPNESGFCFDSGIVTGSSNSTEEVSQSFALMPGRPALLVIQMRDAMDGDKKDTLKETLPELRAQLDKMAGKYKILREDRRIVAGMDAEEVLFSVQAGDVAAYRFYLLAAGDPSTLAKPHTSIQLLLGAARADMRPEDATSPVDEAEALAIWDSLLKSLRVRPGAV